MLFREDIDQIRDRGSDLRTLEKQLERFQKGFPYARLKAPASVGNGISAFTDTEKKEIADYFDTSKRAYNICRFVPASGAATRMFKDLFALRSALEGKSVEEQQSFLLSDATAKQFFNDLDRYPFYADLPAEEHASPLDVLDLLLTQKGLDYGMLPKGLLKFHTHKGRTRTAFEEHLHEAAHIMLPGKTVKVHFTVSEEHLDGFKSLEKKIVPKLREQYGVRFVVSYSFQKKETDTIAVDMTNAPFRDEQGALVFRPGGHGALLQNLWDIDSEVLLINNIDNVSPERTSANRVLHKKVLAGTLLQAREKVFGLLDQLEDTLSEEVADAAARWLREVAFTVFPDDFSQKSLPERAAWLREVLDRPLRVCGMVRNEGEPGGGPFYVEDTQGNTALQIVESSQVDPDDATQQELFRKASHFNPVDIVCSTIDRHGKKYRLPEFTDEETGFISKKSVRGKELKALELPGLWNGSMARWITLFVEVPGSTFTPVKTIFDLLREDHRE
ncbi:MAG: DUF4301 family protein [Bacteroidales bacterium]|nr:DUF4301 family protein [Bacteroidales bacterium]MDT8432181.1 DUF4301 family protein [Bacteroidales bacterium]